MDHRVCTDVRLQSFLQGTMFRPYPADTNDKQVLLDMQSGIRNLIETWYQTFNIPPAAFREWETLCFSELKIRLDRIWNLLAPLAVWRQADQQSLRTFQKYIICG